MGENKYPAGDLWEATNLQDEGRGKNDHCPLKVAPTLRRKKKSCCLLSEKERTREAILEKTDTVPASKRDRVHLRKKKEIALFKPPGGVDTQGGRRARQFPAKKGRLSQMGGKNKPHFEHKKRSIY